MATIACVLFSLLKDFDPRGTGVLRPDDIPSALGTALCIFSHKMDPNR